MTSIVTWFDQNHRTHPSFRFLIAQTESVNPGLPSEATSSLAFGTNFLVQVANIYPWANCTRPRRPPLSLFLRLSTSYCAPTRYPAATRKDRYTWIHGFREVIHGFLLPFAWAEHQRGRSVQWWLNLTSSKTAVEKRRCRKDQDEVLPQRDASVTFSLTRPHLRLCFFFSPSIYVTNR